LAAVKTLVELKCHQGVLRANAQVYRENWRARNLFFSLGFVEDSTEEEQERFVSLTCRLNEAPSAPSPDSPRLGAFN
jgi:hypothetical protein